jgi:hypothetical protein
MLRKRGVKPPLSHMLPTREVQFNTGYWFTLYLFHCAILQVKSFQTHSVTIPLNLETMTFEVLEGQAQFVGITICNKRCSYPEVKRTSVSKATAYLGSDAGSINQNSLP